MPDLTFETRTVAASFEMRDDAATGAPILEGYAATFGQPYDMGPFWEQIDRHAFDKTLMSKPDVRLLVDHGGQPLARTKSGTLELSTDDNGLRARAVLDPSDPDVQRLLPKMRRGDLDEMSFAFRLAGEGDSWDYGPDRTLRTIREAALTGGDVSVVTYPANPTTSVSLRALDLHRARCVYVEHTARELRGGREIPKRELAKLARQIDALVREARALTANDMRDSLSEAVTEAFSGDSKWVYVVDYDDTYVYFTVIDFDDNDEDMYRQGYVIAADGMASLTGDAEQVRRRSTYVPVTDPDGEDQTLTPAGSDSSDDSARSGLRLDYAARIARALDIAA